MMACPKCGCKVTYCCNGDDMGLNEYDMERCSSCGTVFYLMDSTEDDDGDIQEIEV